MPYVTGDPMKPSRRWIATALTTAAEVETLALPWAKPIRAAA